MGYLIVNWVLSAVGLFGIAAVLPGFRVLDYESALLAAGLVSLISALIATAFREVAGIPAQAVSAALLLVLDTFLFRLSGLLVPGFAMNGFFPAIAGAIVLLGVTAATAYFLRDHDSDLPHASSGTAFRL